VVGLLWPMLPVIVIILYIVPMPVFHIIDDEEILCELAAELISSAGFETISYTSPVDYLNYVNSDAYVVPDAIFTDIQMPGMNGYELIDKIRVRFPDMKIVVVSGYYSATAARRYNVWKYLPKPYMPEQIIAIATEIVQYCHEGEASSLKPQASSLKPQASSLKPQAS